MSLEHQEKYRLMMALLSQSVKRLFIPIIAVYTCIAALATLTDRYDFVVYILVISVMGLFIFTIIGFVSRWHFARSMRHLDPMLAETVGLDGKMSWRGIYTTISEDRFYTFMRQRRFFALRDLRLKYHGLILYTLQLFVLICAWLSVASYFVLFSIAHSFLLMHG